MRQLNGAAVALGTSHPAIHCPPGGLELVRSLPDLDRRFAGDPDAEEMLS